MTKPRRDWLLPAISLLCLAFIGLFLRFFSEPHYALGDDFYLARAFAGEVGGVPESYNLYIHTAFAWLLHGLTLLFPGVWWFSWLQVFLCALGAFGVLLGLARLCRRLRLSPWLGFACGLAFLCIYVMEFLTAVTFTTTCALLGAGGVCLLAGAELDPSGKGLSLALLGSVAPIACAYMLRSTAALPPLAFWVGLLGCRLCGQCARRGPSALAPSHRPLVKALALVAAVWLALIGVRAAENALTPEEADYRAFLNATVVPIDYGGLDAATPETLALNGWTDKELALIRSWYFMDENMSAEAFSRVEADALSAPAAPLGQRLLEGAKRLKNHLERSANVRALLLSCLLLCAAAFIAACLRRERLVWPSLAPVGCAAVALLLLYYLAFQGRLPVRAAVTVLLPANAMALGLALEGLSKANTPRRFARGATAAGLALALLVGLPAGVQAFQVYFHPDPYDQNQCVYRRVDEYALAHPDALLIGDRTLGTDSRLFPFRSAGTPVNLLPMWGGWNNHSQGYRAAFAKVGLDHAHFTIAAFLGQRVRLVTGEGGVSPEFLAYLEEQAGGGVAPVAEYEGDGFTVYRFQAVF